MSFIPAAAAAPYRVIIVDDAAVIRSVTSRLIAGDPLLKVVGTASNGKLAIELLQREAADVVVLDIEMPVMDGLTALPLLKAVDPGVQIIMSSTLTQKNADISLQAMTLGAADYIAKPTAAQELSAEGFGPELIGKIKLFGQLARRRNVRQPVGEAAAKAPVGKSFTLRKDIVCRPDIVAIGSSTGGPQALFTAIKALGDNLPVPVLITQHMLPTFTATLAAHISRQCGVSCAEAKDGDILKPRQYYVAPGDYHMLAVKRGPQVVLKLTQDAKENFCRPAVDPMLRSLAAIYGKRILVMMLTGLGQDGCAGSRVVTAGGGTIIAQDEATSVVWGMPGAVALAGLCNAVMPIGEIGAYARQIATKAGP